MYACTRWYYDIDIAMEGESLESLWDHRTCALYQNGQVHVDEDLDELGEWEQGGDNPYCNEHEGETTYFAAAEDAYQQYQDDEWFFCNDHEDETLVFDNEEYYLAHRDEIHGEDVDDEEDEDEDEETTPHRDHPALNSAQRHKIREVDASYRAQGLTASGWLVQKAEHWDNGDYETVFVTYWKPRLPTEREIRRFETDHWPQHFYIAADDPHIKGSGVSIHLRWVA